MPWARRRTRGVPSVGSPTQTLELNDYSKGYNSFVSNDKLPVKNGGTNLWRLAQDARIITLGEYETRKGVDFHSDAAGETEDDTITSTTGAADADFSETAWLAQVFTTTSAGRLSKIRVNIKNDQSATGTPIFEIWSNSSGEPGTMLARSSVAAADVTSSYSYLTVRFAEAPELSTSTDYWIVAYVQSTGANAYSWSSTTAETTALSSSDSGGTWSSTSYALNFYQHYATDGGIKGLHRAYKSDGTAVTVFAHGTSLYTVNNSTGALTAIKTGLNASATEYDFELVNDVLYYVNGYDGYRKWDFTTESQVSATNYTHIVEHKGLMFLASKDDPNKVVYSNFADYETFTSTDFIYVPSPKTGDPVSALVPNNGLLFIYTKNNKFLLSGSDNATFALDEAPDQNGTPNMRTVTKDDNYMYYLTNDGVYRSNGSEAQLLSSDVYNDILNLPNKDDAAMVINRGRLYLWYTPSAESENSKCYVFSLNFGDDGGTTESLDTDSFVNEGFTAFKDDNDLLVGSSRIGQIYWQEKDSNDYTNLGGDINYELDTHYFVGSSPAVFKENRFFEPRFGAQSGNYTITIQYAYDLRDNWETLTTPSVQGSGPVWGSFTWGSATWGTSAETQVYTYIPGSYRRVAVRYKHYATRQPHKFLGHTFVNEQKSIR